METNREDKFIFRLCKVLKKGEPYFDDDAPGSVEKVATIDGTDDEYGGDRIRVRLRGLDSNIVHDEDLPYCFPLLPKMLHVKPKPGEMVMVFFQEQGNSKGVRLYIGPVIPQDYDLNFSGFRNSYKMFPGEYGDNVLPNPSMNPNTQGTLPENDDVEIKSRGNTDIVLKDDEIRLRCGYKTPYPINKEDSLRFNQTDMGYIQMKYSPEKDEKDKSYSSIVNVVADRINLLSHDSKEKLDLLDKDNLISDKEMLDMFRTAQSLPYGDLLVSFLKKFLIVFGTHTHAHSMLPPVLNDDMKALLSTDLNEILCKTIKIN